MGARECCRPTQLGFSWLSQSIPANQYQLGSPFLLFQGARPGITEMTTMVTLSGRIRTSNGWVPGDQELTTGVGRILWLYKVALEMSSIMAIIDQLLALELVGRIVGCAENTRKHVTEEG